MPIANGIEAETGRPLPDLSREDLDALAQREEATSATEEVSQGRLLAEEGSFAVIGEVEPNKLDQAGWGIVFPAEGDWTAVKEALKPLLDHRREETGEALFKAFEGGDGYRPGETAVEWVARHGASMNVVDPLNGVPFYLLLVGSPQEFPFEFQYVLDIYWAVGRLHFDGPEGYRRYAEQVVAYERADTVPHGHQAGLFATRHDFDRATQLFAAQVAEPLVTADGPRGRLGQAQKFEWQTLIGETATKESLRELFRGRLPGGPPALLLTGSHGMAFKPDDPRLAEAQGALVCQDWSGYGEIGPEHWFGAADLPDDAQVHGLIHFFFACYSAGCPQFDNFNRVGAQPKQRAPKDLLARLPQALLERGALATLGHVDRAWAYSFQSQARLATPQLQGFRDVLGRLLRGDRLGQATDQFNVRWAALSTELAEAVQDRKYDGATPQVLAKLASRWVARDDARNYVILGDPAVRLRVEAMPA